MIAELEKEVLPNGLKRFIQIDNLLLDAVKQEIVIKVNYVLKTPTLNEVVSVESTEIIFRKNIDETTLENKLWSEVLNLSNSYLELISVGTPL